MAKKQQITRLHLLRTKTKLLCSQHSTQFVVDFFRNRAEGDTFALACGCRRKIVPEVVREI